MLIPVPGGSELRAWGLKGGETRGILSRRQGVGSGVMRLSLAAWTWRPQAREMGGVTPCGRGLGGRLLAPPRLCSTSELICGFSAAA